MNDPRNRREPALTSTPLDLLDTPLRAAPVQPPAPEDPPAGPPWFWLGALACVLLLSAGLVLWREPLGRVLVPDPPLTQQLAAAEAALKRGELSRADGRGARELFQAVLATDPDHPGARQGLAAVRDAALALASAALEVGDRVRAREAMALATALSAPAAQLQPLQARLAAAEASQQDVEQLLVTAQTLQQQGRDDDALQAYQRVLQRTPDSALALAGRRAVLSSWLRQAQSHLSVGELSAAEALVAKVSELDASHLELPPVRAALGEQQAARLRERERETQAAASALAAGRLDQAWQLYQRQLQEQPDSAALRTGASQVLDALAARIRRQLADFEFAAAQADLDTLRRWSPSAPSLGPLSDQLKRARQAREAQPSAANRSQLPALLAASAAALEAGRLLEPPGDNAWDSLRRASAIAPDDAAVAEAFRRFEQAARQCFESHALANRLSDAEACLDARSLREPPQALADARRRLALRWLALANERIGMNEPELAERALRAARRLDARAPGLQALEERLAQVFSASGE